LKSRCQFSHTGNQDGEERRPRSSNAISPKELSVEQSWSKNAAGILGFVASLIREHYKDKDKRNNNLTIRLIGEQAIALAQYSHRLIDVLKVPNDTSSQQNKRLALRKWHSI